jgi:hypothetical protein
LIQEVGGFLQVSNRIALLFGEITCLALLLLFHPPLLQLYALGLDFDLG